MKNIILLPIVLLFSISTLAGRAEGQIDFIQAGSGWTTDDVYFLVKVEGSRTDMPTCATDHRMAVNPATEAGKIIVSMLMAAKAANQAMLIVGKNNCNLMGEEFESISYIRVF